MNNSTELWAKDSGETLLTHSLTTAQVARKICSQLPFDLPTRTALADTIALIGALHDAGKAATGFQTALRNKSGWGHRHEILSAAIAGIIVTNISQAELLAIITHHRVIINRESKKCLPEDELPFTQLSTWQEMVEELKENLSLLSDFLYELGQQAGLILDLQQLPLCCVREKFQLKERWLVLEHQRLISSSERRRAALLRGLLMTSDHLASAHQVDLPIVPVLKTYHQTVLEKEFGGHQPRPFQARCAETTGDTILKAPTGAGKTGAILLWAAHNQVENGRLFYTLPHTASINAMYRRLCNIYGKEPVGILHHKNAAYLYRIFEEEGCSYAAQKQATTIAGLARELYHPIRVTTPHQILRVALRGKGWEMGLAEFYQAGFIFDEIHAFEPRLTGLTIATAKWLKSMGAKLLFASATLPKFLEDLLVQELQIDAKNIILPNAELPLDRAVLDKKRHHIIIKSGSLLDNLSNIVGEIRSSNQTTLIVCNHVATSQTVWERLNNHYKLKATLLHSRFNGADRMRIETTITSNKPPDILVATQAVEVSLNLDYQRGYSEPAPIDALGQRLGRINRQGDRPPATVTIFAEPSNGHLYDEEITNRTVQLLADVQELSENQLTDIVNEIYSNGYNLKAKKEYEIGLNNSSIRNFEKDLIAGIHRSWVEEVISGTDGQIEVLPFSLYEQFKQHRKNKEMLLARQLLVPIRTGQFFKLNKAGVLYRDDHLRELITTLNYHPDSGLDLNQQIDNIF